MSLWGKLDAANNAPKHKSIIAGSTARGNVAYQNTTVNSFVDKQGATLYGVNTTEANLIQKGVHPGWVIMRTGAGPVASITVNAGGVNIANGETVTLSNGYSNGLLTLTSNATGNVASAVITTGGVFDTNTTVAIGFNRQRHLASILITGTATGFSNTDTIRVSNGTTNATATLATNSTGGTLVVTITNVGLFSNTTSNTQTVVAVLANTGANSAGSGATFQANVSPSTGGSITINTLGGRAGRKQYETLAVVRISTSNTGDDTPFPDS